MDKLNYQTALQRPGREDVSAYPATYGLDDLPEDARRLECPRCGYHTMRPFYYARKAWGPGPVETLVPETAPPIYDYGDEMAFVEPDGSCEVLYRCTACKTRLKRTLRLEES